MDKYEYKVRSEEIKSLVEEKNFKKAAEIADTIDWRRVKSVLMLCTISDVYKMVRRYEDSKALLLLAYEKRPGSRMIIYALTELCIKLGDVVQAWEYYKEFCQTAPEDNRKYILLYKIYVAQDVSLEEQIKVLETLKEKEYTERWAYELAYLYHRMGLGEKCVEECDEIILWFGEGRFVRKAMELKMLHKPLTAKQQALYNGERQLEAETGETKVIPNLDAAIMRENAGVDPSSAPTIEFPAKDLEEIQVRTMDVNNQYNTINLQKALAESMADIWEGDKSGENAQQPAADAEQGQPENTEDYDADEQPDENAEDNWQSAAVEDTGEIRTDEVQEAQAPAQARPLEETQEMPHQPETEEVFFEDPATADMTASIHEITAKLPNLASMTRMPVPPVITPQMVSPAPTEQPAQVRTEVLQTGTVPPAAAQSAAAQSAAPQSAAVQPATAAQPAAAVQQPAPDAPTYEAQSEEAGVSKVIIPTKAQSIFRTPEEKLKPTEFAEQSTGFDDMLSQEADGQISLVVPESQVVEKQITGQLSIQDILKEWERLKKEKEEKLKEDVKKKVQEQTGDIFAEFDEASKNGLLEQLQKKAVIAEEAEKARAAMAEKEPEAEEEQTEEETPEEDIGKEDSTEEPDTEAAAETPAETQPADKKQPVKPAPVADRALTPEERELFDSYIQSKRTRAQLIATLEQMSLAPFTGNVLVSGESDAGTMNFAKNLVQHMKMTDHNFSGRAAKIKGQALNHKEIAPILEKMKNGALIVEDAGGINCSTAEAIVKALQNEERGILMILVDTKGAIDSLLGVNDVLKEPFNARVDIEALNDSALVAYGKRYAYEKEYAIDEMGMLALHTRISDMQTMEHAVTVGEVRQIVKNAITHANRKNLKHFWDVLFGRRYDEEDMIVLRENDFLSHAS